MSTPFLTRFVDEGKLRQIVDLLCHQHLEIHCRPILEDLEAAAGSAPELTLALALCVAAREKRVSVCTARNIVWLSREPSQETLCLYPQAQLGKHRVDLLLRLQTGNTERVLIVECDGHEFHEKTREQASRDRQRDRDLQNLGYRVFRFTGHDIWQDVFRCADEVLRALIATTYNQQDQPEQQALFAS